MPTRYFRFKYDAWEETDLSFFKVFGHLHKLHRARFLRRTTGADVITIDGYYRFVWD